MDVFRNSPANSQSARVTSTQDLSPMILGPAVKDSEIDGLDLESAAASLGVSQEDIWRRIRNGQLIARSALGKVYVYTDIALVPEHTSETDSTLPPRPDEASQEVVLSRMGAYSEYDPSLQSLVPSNQEIATLVEHLSLAKEENRELLRFTRESMQRMSELSDAMLKMKEDVIAAREDQLAVLSEQLREQNEKVQSLTREKENLETVAKFIKEL